MTEPNLPYRLKGIVVHGEGRGRTVGMPTANLAVSPGQALPPFGVYASRVLAQGREYAGVTNVGLRPTLTDGQTPTVETFLLGFSGDLYGREITVILCAFLRPTRKMGSLREVEAQVEKDVQAARRILDSQTKPPIREENMPEYHLHLPLSGEDIGRLHAGDTVYLTGTLLTGRDAAHKRLIQLLDEGKPLPVDVRGQAIYYVGPAPAPPGYAVGAAGPTTSYRMDAYTPQLLKMGLNCMIGKGRRSDAVRAAIREHGAVYLGAVGGAAALIARSIKKSEVIAYPDLGTEAIHRFTVEEFPAIVLMDVHGGDLYVSGPEQYRQEEEQA